MWRKKKTKKQKWSHSSPPAKDVIFFFSVVAFNLFNLGRRAALLERDGPIVNSRIVVWGRILSHLWFSKKNGANGHLFFFLNQSLIWKLVKEKKKAIFNGWKLVFSHIVFPSWIIPRNSKKKTFLKCQGRKPHVTCLRDHVALDLRSSATCVFFGTARADGNAHLFATLFFVCWRLFIIFYIGWYWHLRRLKGRKLWWIGLNDKQMTWSLVINIPLTLFSCCYLSGHISDWGQSGRYIWPTPPNPQKLISLPCPFSYLFFFFFASVPSEQRAKICKFSFFGYNVFF